MVVWLRYGRDFSVSLLESVPAGVPSAKDDKKKWGNAKDSVRVVNKNA